MRYIKLYEEFINENDVINSIDKLLKTGNSENIYLAKQLIVGQNLTDYYAEKYEDLEFLTQKSMFELFGINRLAITRRTNVLPDSICDFENIIFLDVIGKELLKLPDNIGHLINLKMLNLSDNKLTALPKSIVDCVNLQIINLSKNNFIDIPKEIEMMPKISQINFTHNKIETIPNDFSSTSKMLTITLSKNNELEIPDYIKNNKNLLIRFE
jgi:hypothetical protein